MAESRGETARLVLRPGMVREVERDHRAARHDPARGDTIAQALARGQWEARQP